MGALADCELFIHSFFGQPSNSITTLAFVLGGLMVLRHTDVRWVGIGLIATGVGSFMFHGPVPPGSEWAHDVSLAWLIPVVAGLGARWERWTRLPGLIAIGLLFALFPVAADPLAAVLAVVAVGAIIRHDRSTTNLALLAGLGAVAIVGRLGATGGPLCDPSSVWQPHALWHVGAATVVTWWALRHSRGQKRVYPT